MASELSSVGDAVTQVKDGGFVIVVDDEDRENEGDLIMAAQMATQENMSFMIRHRVASSAPHVNHSAWWNWICL